MISQINQNPLNWFHMVQNGIGQQNQKKAQKPHQRIFHIFDSPGGLSHIGHSRSQQKRPGHFEQSVQNWFLTPGPILISLQNSLICTADGQWNHQQISRHILSCVQQHRRQHHKQSYEHKSAKSSIDSQKQRQQYHQLFHLWRIPARYCL